MFKNFFEGKELYVLVREGRDGLETFYNPFTKELKKPYKAAITQAIDSILNLKVDVPVYPNARLKPTIFKVVEGSDGLVVFVRPAPLPILQSHISILREFLGEIKKELG